PNLHSTFLLIESLSVTTYLRDEIRNPLWDLDGLRLWSLPTGFGNVNGVNEALRLDVPQFVVCLASEMDGRLTVRDTRSSVCEAPLEDRQANPLESVNLGRGIDDHAVSGREKTCLRHSDARRNEQQRHSAGHENLHG